MISKSGDMSERDRFAADSRHMAEQLDHFFAMSQDLLCIASMDGYFTKINEAAWTQALGHSPADLLGRPFLDFVHPADVARTVAELERLALNQPTIQFENRYRASDGRYRWLSWSATPMPEERTIFAIARDITAQREAAGMQARLAAIVNSTADAVIGKDLDGTITAWNPAAERIYGYRADEAIGQSIALIFPPDQRHRVDDLLARIVRGETIREEACRVRKDGTILHLALTISPVRSVQGAVFGAASIARDISDSRKAEERFRRLVLSAPDAMIIVDAAGRITLVNEQAERLFGYASGELVGQPVEVLVPAELRDAHITERADFTKHPTFRGMGADMDLFGVRKDGTRFAVEVSLAPLDIDEGELVSASIRDITERKRVEHDLAAARDEALAAAQLKSQFVAMVSHEIRTPMNGVIGLTKLLLDTPLQPTQRRYGEAIRTSARALLAIINDILDFSKIEAGKVTLVDSDFNIGDLVEDVAHVAAEAARQKHLEILAYYPPETPRRVRGDEGRIRQVLLNLVTNAVKFTQDGEVLLRAESAQLAGRPALTCSVTDTGIGIAPADLTRLFEPFTQADGTTSRQYGGTGLGLTISRQLVELMSGRFDVHSEPGRGSRFSFTIPVGMPAGNGGPQPGEKHWLVGERILIVDDNASSLELLAAHAESWGMRVRTARDALSGIGQLREAAASREPIGIVVVDQRMPGIDGAQFIDQITGDPAIPAVRPILLTNGTFSDDQEATALLDVAILAKPVGPSALYNCLMTVLDPADLENANGGPPAAAPQICHGTVLLAEDNEINQMVAVDTLASLGYDTDVARNGLEALEMAREKPYLAVLMDCQMPMMDGYRATEEIRRREEADRHIPIIAMTAGALAEDRRRCLDAGMDDYLAKPIDPDELQAALHRWSR